MKMIFIYKKFFFLSSLNPGSLKIFWHQKTVGFQYLRELANIRGRFFHFQIKTRVCRNGNCIAGLYDAPFGPRWLDLNFPDGYREVLFVFCIKGVSSRQNDTGRKCRLFTFKSQTFDIPVKIVVHLDHVIAPFRYSVYFGHEYGENKILCQDVDG